MNKKNDIWVPADTEGTVWVTPPWVKEDLELEVYFICGIPFAPAQETNGYAGRNSKSSLVDHFERMDSQNILPLPDCEGPNLERDLRLNRRISHFAKDKDFALKLYRALCKNTWFFKQIPSCTWTCTCRYAERVIDALRHYAEDAVDFALIDDEGLVNYAIRQELDFIGWATEEPDSRTAMAKLCVPLTPRS